MTKSETRRLRHPNTYSDIATKGNRNTVGTTRKNAWATFDGIETQGHGHVIGDHTGEHFEHPIKQDGLKQAHDRKYPGSGESSCFEG